MTRLLYASEFVHQFQVLIPYLPERVAESTSRLPWRGPIGVGGGTRGRLSGPGRAVERAKGPGRAAQQGAGAPARSVQGGEVGSVRVWR